MAARRTADGVMTPQMAVRRLTPRECERLQGFPDDYTLVEYRGKLAADGPRYKALGNSMAVPVMRWIGQRIAAVDAILREIRHQEAVREPACVTGRCCRVPSKQRRQRVFFLPSSARYLELCSSPSTPSPQRQVLRMAGCGGRCGALGTCGSPTPCFCSRIDGERQRMVPLLSGCDRHPYTRQPFRQVFP